MTNDKELIERMKAAIEGECNGLAIDDTQAKAILDYVLGDYLAERGGEAVAWMSPGKERLEFSRPDTVYGSHTLPLFLGPQVFELDAEYERGKSDGWEACETCHGIVDGKLPTRSVGDTDFEPKTCPEAYLQQEIAKLRKQPAIPEGMALVPIEPTEAMIEAGKWQIQALNGLESAYKAMIAAAGVKPCQKPSKLQEEINAVAASIHANAKVKP